MKYLIIFMLALFMASPASAQDLSVTELRVITQGGGSLIIDMDKREYTVSELKMLADSLKYQATLTIKMGARSTLNAQQCAQIAKGHPGHVIFWF